MFQQMNVLHLGLLTIRVGMGLTGLATTESVAGVRIAGIGISLGIVSEGSTASACY